MNSDQISTIEIVTGEIVTPGDTDGYVVARFPVGTHCIELTALRGEMTNTARLGIRGAPYPCFLCKLWIKGPQKDSFQLSHDGLQWIDASSYLFFKIVQTYNEIFYIRSQTYEDEAFKDYVENYLYLEFQAPIGSSGSAT